MNTISAIQIFIILSFIFSLRMKIWKTSLNSFIFVFGLFLLTVTIEIPYFKDIWATYHTSVIGATLFIVMARVSYQSLYKKYRALFCNDCTNYNRRSTDK